MSALYSMQFSGQAGGGIGSLYVGKGKVAGIDAGGVRYEGSYTEQGGRVKGMATMWVPPGGMLVTGQVSPGGAKIPLTVDWPANFADGSVQTISVGGNPVRVVFDKVSDIP